VTTGARRWASLLIIIAVDCFGQNQSESTNLIAAKDALSIDVLNQALRDSRRVVRAMDDRNTNLRWLLLKDGQHPTGPGRLVAIQTSSRNAAAADSQRLGSGPVRPLIKIGDRVVVEEHTRAFDARFEAVALEAASAGSNLRVRLRLGGKIVDAVAQGPGLVEMATGREGHR